MKIIISNDIKNLTGQGIEYLTDQSGEVIAEFYDGNMTQANPTGNNEKTLILKAG